MYDIYCANESKFVKEDCSKEKLSIQLDNLVYTHVCYDKRRYVVYTNVFYVHLNTYMYLCRHIYTIHLDIQNF